MNSLERLSKFELDIFEEIIECPRCLASENICNSHAKAVKTILMKEVKVEIEKLTVTNNKT